VISKPEIPRRRTDFLWRRLADRRWWRNPLGPRCDRRGPERLTPEYLREAELYLLRTIKQCAPSSNWVSGSQSGNEPTKLPLSGLKGENTPANGTRFFAEKLCPTAVVSENAHLEQTCLGYCAEGEMGCLMPVEDLAGYQPCPHSGKPQTESVSCIPRRRITLSVSEGTVWPEPRPLADAQGYPEYAI